MNIQKCLIKGLSNRTYHRAKGSSRINVISTLSDFISASQSPDLLLLFDVSGIKSEAFRLGDIFNFGSWNFQAVENSRNQELIIPTSVGHTLMRYVMIDQEGIGVCVKDNSLVKSASFLSSRGEIMIPLHWQIQIPSA